ncbi:unnamed protein product [Ilex paraguariensis]|uniref:Uncharacterized protein n=1 Tax=Ilex paraguariensis TaxID=185542 RepID=A0ABC8TZB5_9AQUA
MLTGAESSVDVATEENLNRLVEIGEKLLKKPVSRVNLETGFTEPVNNGGKNEYALKKYGGNQTIFFVNPVGSWLPKNYGKDYDTRCNFWNHIKSYDLIQ